MNFIFTQHGYGNYLVRFGCSNKDFRDSGIGTGMEAAEMVPTDTDGFSSEKIGRNGKVYRSRMKS